MSGNDDNESYNSSDEYSEYSSSDLSSPESEEGDQIEPVVLGAEPYRFEPLAPAGDGDAEDRGGEPAAADERLGHTEWCTCGHCTVQTLADNCRCCKEVAEISEKMNSLQMDCEDPDACITQHDWFVACCLNPGTLSTAYLQYRSQYGRRAVEGTVDQKYRHVAYRQVVRWCWGYLGRLNRVPLPSCVMNTIRTTFPNPDGNYKGFQLPPLD